MFTKRLNQLWEGALGGPANTAFSDVTGYDRSYISRLRGGDRVPAPNSKAARNLIQALVLYAQKTGRTGELRAAVGRGPDVPASDLPLVMMDWLYEGYRPAQGEEEARAQAAGDFGRRLDAVMALTELSNVRLARLANVDASLVSRYRRGLRLPRSNREIVSWITRVLFQRIQAQGRLDRLAQLTGIPAETLADEEAGFPSFRAWLCDAAPGDGRLVERFLESVNGFSPAAPPGLDVPDGAGGLDDGASEYRGNAGLRRAALRFLGEALSRRAGELLLYSDQSTRWMTEDPRFTQRWAALMAALAQNGTRIKIIHHVDRGLEEMLDAIQNWMPLYMSGQIESWYCPRENGGRFCHTLFLAPGGAGVAAVFVPGREPDARYRYLTDPQDLAPCQELFEDLLAQSRPLASREPPGEDLGEPVAGVPFSHIRVLLGKRSVTVRHLAQPAMSFTLTHPMIRAAFASYAKLGVSR